ncbi:Apoptosis-antagonizing transcription factor-like protein [Elsinoe fawcettii]|nr:Apoptosis-antagonizing transcription factor-like protein [Elsinoe fawcettii]
MAGKKHSGLLQQLADLDDPTPKDFDPEDDRPIVSDEEQSARSDGSEDEPEDAARDHYVSVEKSKLRRPEQPSLGPQYAGSRVSRDAATTNDDEEDDPFARGFDDGSSENDDEAMDGEDLAEEDSADDSVVEDDEMEEVGSEDEATDDTEASSDEDEEKKETGPAINGFHKAPEAAASDARKLLARQQKSVLSTMSQAAKDEAEKGLAVRKQRTTFDNLLNTRIKLQKAIIGTNTLSGLARDAKLRPEEDIETVFRSAETAALSLWNSITSLRDALQENRMGKKRKHTEFDIDTSTKDLWRYSESQESACRDWRDATLEKWYARTHVTEAIAQNRDKLSQSKTSSSVHDILSNHLNDTSRLLKRARTPRSCAPYQLQQVTAKKPRFTDPEATGEDEQLQRRDVGDPTIYDDADVYSVLLSALLEQKSSFTPGTATQTKGSAEDFRGMNGYQIRREAKTKKVVDTKASKGRKLRYTVHEKLMNYCAPEDRGTWGERQIDDLFSSLLGRRVALESDDEDAGEADDGWTAVDEGEKTLLFGR